MAAIDFASFRSVVIPLLKEGLGVLIRGPHGIGKSSLIYQLQNELSDVMEVEQIPDPKKKGKFIKYKYPVVERRASQMPDAGDLIGLPFLDGETTKFRPMAWFHRACSEPCILFFDELDRAAMDVRQAFFEVADSRKIAGQHLHPKTVLLAAVNSGPHDNNTYQVGEFDVAELDRWAVFDVAPSHDDFFKYARSKLPVRGPFDPVIYDFLKENVQHLEHTDAFEPNKVYPSRRSWERLDRAFKNTEWLKDPVTKARDGSSMPRPEITFISQSLVGEEAGIAFASFVKNYERNVTLEDILIKGKLEIAKDLSEDQYMALIEKFENSKYAKNELKGDILTNLCRFIKIVPEEMAMKVWEVTTRVFALNGVHVHQTELKKEDCPEFDDDDPDVLAISDYLAYLNGADRETDV